MRNYEYVILYKETEIKTHEELVTNNRCPKDYDKNLKESISYPTVGIIGGKTLYECELTCEECWNLEVENN